MVVGEGSVEQRPQTEALRPESEFVLVLSTGVHGTKAIVFVVVRYQQRNGLWAKDGGVILTGPEHGCVVCAHGSATSCMRRRIGWMAVARYDSMHRMDQRFQINR